MKMLSKILIDILFILSVLLHEGFATIFTAPFHQSNLTRREFRDLEADFGETVPDIGILGVLEVAKPLNACSPVKHVSKDMQNNRVFALVMESSSQRRCPFDLQVLYCQRAGYDAVIVYNKNFNNQLRLMTGGGPYIPSVYVTRRSGEILKDYTYKTSSIQILPNQRLPLQLYLIPFVVVVGICFFFMVIFSLVRYCRYRMRQKKSRLSPKSLKKIPTKKFKKGDEYDMCAICLEDYEEGDKIRLLPCHHAYHCKCVDPWLTSGKKVCPVCKQAVDPKIKNKRKLTINRGSTSTPVSPSDIGDEVNTNSETDTDERTPLLSNAQDITSTGAINV